MLPLSTRVPVFERNPKFHCCATIPSFAPLRNLLNVSRGMLEYGMVWAGACISVLIAIAAYQAVSMVERLMR